MKAHITVAARIRWRGGIAGRALAFGIYPAWLKTLVYLGRLDPEDAVQRYANLLQRLIIVQVRHGRRWRAA